MEKNYFTKLPNNLFYATTEELNILKECKDYKVLLVLDYLYTNTNRRNESIFVLEDIVVQGGFKPDNHKGKINDKFKAILIKLQELEIIESITDLNTIKSKELIRTRLKLFAKDKEGNDIKFIQLFDTEKEKILTYNKEKIDNLKLLYYYCYLKARMYKRTDNLTVAGGKAEICYPSFQKINEDILLNAEVIEKYNKILVKLNLIRIDNAGLWFYKEDKNKIVRESNNIYTLFTKNEEVWKLNLKEGIKFYRKQYFERVFTNKRTYKNNNNKKIKGYIARIEYLEQQGKAKEKQIEKKNKLLESINVDATTERYKELLDKKENKGMLLSEIFLSYGNEEKSDQIYSLEKELGLLDKEDNLTVSLEDYKKIILEKVGRKTN